MGVHVCLYKMPEDQQLAESEWDWIRHAGDRFLWSAFEEIEVDELEIGGLMYYRPVDPYLIPELMNIEHSMNAARWTQLADILTARPDVWVFFSW